MVAENKKVAQTETKKPAVAKKNLRPAAEAVKEAAPAETESKETESKAAELEQTQKDQSCCKRKIGITELILRDGHQSLMATRMSIDDMLPVLETMDDLGYYSMEVWGGATFDTCMRFLNEDPWERLRTIRKHVKKTKLQMLLRGQNLVGYRNYADDTVREFVKRAVANGIDIIRVFDALNDLRNLEVSADQIKKEGAHLQLSIAYTTSPVHTVEAFVKLAARMRDMGADSICIKDMAGLLTPTAAKELVRGIKAETNLPIQVHSHYTCGLASMALFAGIEAGADGIDCALSPFSMGTSHPATESMIAALEGGPFDTGLDLKKFMPVADHFKKVRAKYDNIFVKMQGADTNILLYQIPGGMYSNMVSQLKDLGALDRLQDVLEEVPVVREAMGYPPLVTPTSQMVGTQATMNIIAEQRWKMVPKEIKNYFLGQYGTPPAAMDPEVQKTVIGDETPITCRPADTLKPELEEALKEIGAWMTQPEDLLSYVLFPAVARDFLVDKFARETKRDVGLETLVGDAAYPV